MVLPEALSEITTVGAVTSALANIPVKFIVWFGVHPLTPGVQREFPSIAPISAAEP